MSSVGCLTLPRRRVPSFVMAKCRQVSQFFILLPESLMFISLPAVIYRTDGENITTKTWYSSLAVESKTKIHKRMRAHGAMVANWLSPLTHTQSLTHTLTHSFRLFLIHSFRLLLIHSFCFSAACLKHECSGEYMSPSH